MACPRFRIESSVADGVERLCVVGELDMATAPELARQLARVAAAVVELDLGEVSFIDACGLRVLLGAHARLTGDGHAGLVLVGASRPVRRLLDLAGIAGSFSDAPGV